MAVTRVPVAAKSQNGSGVVSADLTIYYCETATAQLCLVDLVRLQLPVEVRAGGAATAMLRYAVAPASG